MEILSHILVDFALRDIIIESSLIYRKIYNIHNTTSCMKEMKENVSRIEL